MVRRAPNLLVAPALLALVGLPVSAGGPGLLPLAVPGHGAAVVALAGGPRPVLLATHGSFDRPDWHCQTWQPIVGDRLHVLCPRGVLRWDTPKEPEWQRFYYRGAEPLLREIDAGLAALRALLPGQVLEGPMVYLGFSQGAIYGVPLLLREGARFPRAILVEGGGAWTAREARAYARLGGRRVLFACGQAGCARRAQAAAALLLQAGVQARVATAPGMGHTYDGDVARRIGEAMAWLLEDSP